MESEEKQAKNRRYYWLGGKRKPEEDRFFKEALDPSLWQEGTADNWNACWYIGMPEAPAFRGAHKRKINHIPGNNSLTVKSRLYETITAVRDRLSDRYGQGHELVNRLRFLPKVYSMPHDYHALQQAAFEDPDKLWILKPKNAARGKGVRLIRDVATAPLGDSWMVQEYLHKSHTIRGHKYVLRLYVLIASIDPLRVYLYDQGFAKLASAPYDLDDLDNPYAHLTNPDINALNTGVETPVEFIDLEHYRRWLSEQGHDEKLLFERIRDLVTLTAISAAEPMRKRTAESGADPEGCYELLGLDCLIDDELKPWILECNLSPSMGVCAGPESGGALEEQIKARLVADLVSVVGLNLAETPDFPRNTAEGIKAQAEHEAARSGAFSRVYPNREVGRYLPYFSLPRLKDMLLADAVAANQVSQPKLQPRYAAEIVTENKLTLYDTRSGRLISLNDTASFIWLMAMQGLEPDAIAEQLTLSMSNWEEGEEVGPWSIRNDVWNCLAGWSHEGLLVQKTERNFAAAKPARTTELIKAPFISVIHCDNQALEVHTDSPPLAARLKPMLESIDINQTQEISTDEPQPFGLTRLELLRDKPGYSLSLNGELVEAKLPLAAVTPRLMTHLLRSSAQDGEVTMDLGFVSPADEKSGSVAFVSSQPGLADGLALHFAQTRGQSFARGLRFGDASFEHAKNLGFPAQLARSEFDKIDSGIGLTTKAFQSYRHQLAGGTEAFLIAASAASSINEVSIETILFPRRDEAHPTTELKPLPLEEALAELLPSCFFGRGEPIDASALRALVNWLSHRKLYSVNVQDYRAVNDILARHLDARPDELEFT